jgi:hypothetical protein
MESLSSIHSPTTRIRTTSGLTEEPVSSIKVSNLLLLSYRNRQVKLTNGITYRCNKMVA